MDIAYTLRRRSALLLAAAGLGCSDPIAAAARPVAGCYRLEAGPWAGEAPPGPPLPDTVRLLDARGISALEAGRALLRAWPDSARSGYPWSWWEVASPDTLTLVFSTGEAGVRVALRPVADGFGGTMARFATDEPAPGSIAKARLRPLPCREPGTPA